MQNVQLLDGIYRASQEKGKEYLLYLDVDRLVAPCYEGVSETPKKPRYQGWETTGISGHSIGHWLSAAATMYSLSNDDRLLEKLEYAVNELASVQEIDGDGFVSGFSRTCFDNVFTGDFEVDNFSLGGGWVPWYSIHKIYAGLIDTYLLTGNKQALTVVIKLADWAKRGTDRLDDNQFQKMLICEHGGMIEAMADLYKITNNQKYLDLAIRFYHQAVLDPLSKGVDDLQGKHANTQIPKVIGAAKLFELSGDDKYKRIAEFFWSQVTNHRSYVIGGNSIGEHFGPSNTEELGITTTETCNTYNMLKLTERLFDWNQNVEYIDYYEKALYNHILASQDPDSGMKTYFVSTQPGHFKVYCSPDESFWCCTGTGMENPARYNRAIYYRDQGDLYINLFIASEIRLEDKNVIIRQVTTFPETEKTTLVFDSATDENIILHIRVPKWISGQVFAVVNEKKQYASSKNGYLTIEGTWNAGDIIEIQLPMELNITRSKHDVNKSAILYGPIVLAGALGTENFPESDIQADHLKLNNHPLIEVPDLISNESDLRKWIKPTSDPLTFITDAVGQPGNKRVTLIPFYKLHHQRYTIYWNVMDEISYRSFVDKEKEDAARLRAMTVDVVNPNEQQPEVDHSIKKKSSRSGYLNTFNRGWRDSINEGYFSYKMTVSPVEQMYLLVTYSGNDAKLHENGKAYPRDFTIQVNNSVIAHQTLEGNKPGKLFNVCYEIPLSITNGKDKVEVAFSSEEEKVAGGVYGVRIVNDKGYAEGNL